MIYELSYTCYINICVVDVYNVTLVSETIGFNVLCLIRPSNHYPIFHTLHYCYVLKWRISEM